MEKSKKEQVIPPPGQEAGETSKETLSRKIEEEIKRKENLEKKLEELHNEKKTTPAGVIHAEEFKEWRKSCEGLNEIYIRTGKGEERVALLESMVDFGMKIEAFMTAGEDLGEWSELGTIMMIKEKPPEGGICRACGESFSPNTRLVEFSRKVKEKRRLLEESIQEKRGY